MCSLRAITRESKGQALVEMAIILGLLLILVLGIFEFGRFMYTKNTLTQAARSGARTAVVTPNLSPINSSNACTNADVVSQSACRSLPSQPMRDAVNIRLEITAPDGSTHSPATAGDTVTVTVTWAGYQWIALPRLATTTVFPSSIQGATSMRYE